MDVSPVKILTTQLPALVSIPDACPLLTRPFITQLNHFNLIGSLVVFVSLVRWGPRGRIHLHERPPAYKASAVN